MRPKLETKSSIEEVRSVLVEALLFQHGADVDLVLEFGSRIRGNAHGYSDYDLAFVPRRGAEVPSITVLVGNMLFDLFPIGWDSWERLADYDHPNATVLHFHRVLHARNEGVRREFAGLKDRLDRFFLPENRPKALRKAEEVLRRAAFPLLLLRQAADRGDALSAMATSQTVLGAVFHALGALNGVPVDTRKRCQMQALADLPEGFEDTLDRVTPSLDPKVLAEGCEALHARTCDLVQSAIAREIREPASLAQLANAMYPETRADLGKMLNALDQGDPFAAKNSLVSVLHEFALRVRQAETGQVVTEGLPLGEYAHALDPLGLPDLFKSLAKGDAEALRVEIPEFDAKMKAYLESHGARTNDYPSVRELREAIALGTA